MSFVAMRAVQLVLLLVLLLLVCLGGGESACAAEYDLDSPTIELRRLQYCSQCHEPLVVTTIAPGASVRCPKCARVQKRLPTAELEVKVYQICPSCGSRLNVAGLKTGQALRCGSCGLAQRAIAEALYLPAPADGKGEIPDGPTIPPATVLQAPATSTLRPPAVPGLNAPAAQPAPASKPQEKSSGAEAQNGQPSGQAGALPPAPVTGSSLPPEAYEPAGNSLRPAVWVNGKAIPESAIAQVIRKNYELVRLNRYSADGLPKDEEEFARLRTKIIEQQVERELVLQAAANAGVKPTVAALTAYLRGSGGALTAEKANEELILEEMRRRYSSAAAQPTEEALRRFYEKNPALFAKPDRCQLRSIVIYSDRTGRADQRPADQIAGEVRRKLEYGVDFGTLAKRYSEDSFRDEEGELRGADPEGWMAADQLARPVQRRLASFAPGQIAGPQTLPGCIAFFRLEKYEKGEARPFAEVREEVRRAYLEQIRDEAYDNWIASLRRAALVEYPRAAQERAKNAAGEAAAPVKNDHAAVAAGATADAPSPETR